MNHRDDRHEIATDRRPGDPLQELLPAVEGDGDQGEWVPVASLVPADSPRLDGVRLSHAQALAQLHSQLPPIVVRRSTMQVIDGMHRVTAARMLDQEKIRARLIDCGDDDLFVIAVAANVTHGLPLSVAERRAAAARIMQLRPTASDRWIGMVAGLSAPTVAIVRREIPEAAGQGTHRIGRDGRTRPVSTTEGRRLARDIIMAAPDASLRQIAKGAGISVGTARDVREKLRRGEDPIGPERARSSAGSAWQRKSGGAEPTGRGADSLAATVRPRSRHPPCDGADYRSVLERLQRDPSLRYNDAGRAFLRWFSSPRVMDTAEWRQVIDHIPAHVAPDVSRIAHACACSWADFAVELEQRYQNAGTWPSSL